MSRRAEALQRRCVSAQRHALRPGALVVTGPAFETELITKSACAKSPAIIAARSRSCPTRRTDRRAANAVPTRREHDRGSQSLRGGAALNGDTRACAANHPTCRAAPQRFSNKCTYTPSPDRPCRPTDARPYCRGSDRRSRPSCAVRRTMCSSSDCSPAIGEQRTLAPVRRSFTATEIGIHPQAVRQAPSPRARPFAVGTCPRVAHRALEPDTADLPLHAAQAQGADFRMQELLQPRRAGDEIGVSSRGGSARIAGKGTRHRSSRLRSSHLARRAGW